MYANLTAERVAQLGLPERDVAPASPSSATPPWPHQVVLAECMRRTEEARNGDSRDSRVRYKCAVMSCASGTGKTLTLLRHAAARPVLSEETTLTAEVRALSGFVTHRTPIPHRFCFDGTLIVIDHKLFDKWTDAATRMAGLLPDRDLVGYTRFGAAEYVDLAARCRPGITDIVDRDAGTIGGGARAWLVGALLAQEKKRKSTFRKRGRGGSGRQQQQLQPQQGGRSLDSGGGMETRNIRPRRLHREGGGSPSEEDHAPAAVTADAADAAAPGNDDDDILIDAHTRRDIENRVEEALHLSPPSSRRAALASSSSPTPRPRVLIMTSSAYQGFLRMMSGNIDNAAVDARRDFIFQRVALDDAESLHISGFAFPNAHFTWFVTASPEKLAKNVVRAAGMRLSAVCQTSLSGVRSRAAEADAQAWEQITVSCQKEYVDRSRRLPPPRRRVVHVQRRALLEALMGVAPRAVREALAAGDVSGAIAATGCSTVSSEQGLVAAATEHVLHELRKARLQVQVIERMLASEEEEAGGGWQGDNDEYRAPWIQRLEITRAHVGDMERSIDLIGRRVHEADGVCPITMDDIRIPAMTRCCHNTFEWEALLRSLEARPSCPLCRRSPLLLSDIVVMPPRGVTTSSASEEGGEERGSTERPHRDIHEALHAELRRAFRERPDAKVLVFSEHGVCAGVHGSRSLEQTVSHAVGHRYAHAVLKGTCGRVSRVLNTLRNGGSLAPPPPDASAHRPGDDNNVPDDVVADKRLGVLLLNARHFGTGHDMEFATHVITLHDMDHEMYDQVVGRAQRPGRTEPLEVIDIRMDVSEQQR